MNLHRLGILIISILFLSGCVTAKSKEGMINRQTASTTKIEFESKRNNEIYLPFFFMLSGVKRRFHADARTAIGICRYFQFRHAVKYEATITDSPVTWLAEDGTFTEWDQKEGFYALQKITCE